MAPTAARSRSSCPSPPRRSSSPATSAGGPARAPPGQTTTTSVPWGVQRPEAAAAARRAGRHTQRDIAGVVGRPPGGGQDVGDRGRLVAVAAKPPRLVVDHHGKSSQEAARRCRDVSVELWRGRRAGLQLPGRGEECGFLDLLDRVLLAAGLGPTCAAAAWHENLPGDLLGLGGCLTDERRALSRTLLAPGRRPVPRRRGGERCPRRGR